MNYVECSNNTSDLTFTSHNKPSKSHFHIICALEQPEVDSLNWVTYTRDWTCLFASKWFVIQEKMSLHTHKPNVNTSITNPAFFIQTPEKRSSGKRAKTGKTCHSLRLCLSLSFSLSYGFIRNGVLPLRSRNQSSRLSSVTKVIEERLKLQSTTTSCLFVSCFIRGSKAKGRGKQYSFQWCGFS